MAHRKLTNSDEVAAYIRYLDDGYPARQEVIAHLCDRLEQGRGKSDGKRMLRILELACGPGVFAESILKKMPVSEYVGIDITLASLDYARNRVAKLDARTTWLHADLNEPTWLDQIEGRFDAITSLQALHDLGGAVEVQRIVRIALSLLCPGAKLIYADLLRSPDDAGDLHPGRYTIVQHLEMLERTGYCHAECTLQLDGFGCFEATRAAHWQS